MARKKDTEPTKSHEGLVEAAAEDEPTRLVPLTAMDVCVINNAVDDYITYLNESTNTDWVKEELEALYVMKEHLHIFYAASRQKEVNHECGCF